MQVPRARETKPAIHHPHKPEIVAERYVPVEHDRKSGDGDDDDGDDGDVPHHDADPQREGDDDAPERDVEEPHGAPRVGAAHDGVHVAPAPVLGEAEGGRDGAEEGGHVGDEEDLEAVVAAQRRRACLGVPVRLVRPRHREGRGEGQRRDQRRCNQDAFGRLNQVMLMVVLRSSASGVVIVTAASAGTEVTTGMS